MSNKKKLIQKLNKELGDDTKLKEPKTLRLLKEAVELLKENHNGNFEVIKFNKVDFKDYTKKLNNLEKLLKNVDDNEVKKKNLEKIVSKFIDSISKQEYPTEISVNNFPKQKESIEITNFPEQKDVIEVTNFPKEIKVSNFPKPQKRIKVDIDKSIGIKKPVWYKPVNLDLFFTKIGNLLIKVSDRVFKIDVSKHKTAKEAIAVKLVDKNNKFIDQLIPNINVSNPGGSGGPVNKGIINKNGDQINPATEEKQDDIIAVLDKSLASDVEGGGIVSVGITAVEVTFTGTPKTIIITADSTNSGILYVGKSNVTSTGANSILSLLAGQPFTLPVSEDFSSLYVVASVADQKFIKGATL